MPYSCPSAVHCACSSGKGVYSRIRLALTSKYETEFSYDVGLALEVPRLTEGQTRRDVAHMNIGKVSTKEESSILKGGRHRDRRTLAPRTIHPIDDIRISGIPCARDVFPAHRQ
jgi:hypothetical protein